MPSAEGSSPRSVRATARLDPSGLEAVQALVEAAARADSYRPLSDGSALNLHATERDVRHLLCADDDDARGSLLGYAQIDRSERDTDVVELVVHPEHRRCGVGTALAVAVSDTISAGADPAAPGRTLQAWSHGRLPGADRLAEAFGLRPDRVLWRMRRPLDEGLPEPRMPAGVRLRAFVVGRDEARWTELNNRAFAGHPDQGGWDSTRITERETEPWFDPRGFLLAERETDGALLGFHWTKVHTDDAEARAAGGPVGEVYVVGVDPAAQGSGLGSALTLAGLQHLREHGSIRALLYVDESNRSAMGLYERLGFEHADADVAFGRSAG